MILPTPDNSLEPGVTTLTTTEYQTCEQTGLPRSFSPLHYHISVIWNTLGSYAIIQAWREKENED